MATGLLLLLFPRSPTWSLAPSPDHCISFSQHPWGGVAAVLPTRTPLQMRKRRPCRAVTGRVLSLGVDGVGPSCPLEGVWPWLTLSVHLLWQVVCVCGGGCLGFHICKMGSVGLRIQRGSWGEQGPHCPEDQGPFKRTRVQETDFKKKAQNLNSGTHFIPP